MERLTARNKKSPKEAYYPYCFQNDTCDGQGPSDKCDMCPLPYEICETLADYEDTGLTPEQIRELRERDKPRKIELNAGVPICPVCGRRVVRCYDFCPDCGQRLEQ